VVLNEVERPDGSTAPRDEIVPDPAPPIIIVIDKDSCDSSMEFAGISQVKKVGHTSVSLSWKKGPEGIGFTVFKKHGDGFKILKTLKSSSRGYKVKGLTQNRNYEFLVRAVDEDGHFDCNDNTRSIKTKNHNKYISCLDIKQRKPGNLKNKVYVVDPDLLGPEKPLKVFCNMTKDGGGWTRVFSHRIEGGLFSNEAEALSVNIKKPTNNKYSILGRIDDFKSGPKYKIWLHYPELDEANEGNVWRQSSNPVTESISGYEPINIVHNSRFWGGLETSYGGYTLVDGSVNHGFWFYAIGAHEYWPSHGTIPGPSGGIKKVDLYIK